MTRKLTEVSPRDLPCPTCKQRSLDCDMKEKFTFKRNVVWMGMPAVEFAGEWLPYIWCTLPWCDFEQWGRVVDGIYADFGPHEGA